MPLRLRQCRSFAVFPSGAKSKPLRLRQCRSFAGFLSGPPTVQSRLRQCRGFAGFLDAVVNVVRRVLPGGVRWPEGLHGQLRPRYRYLQSNNWLSTRTFRKWLSSIIPTHMEQHGSIWNNTDDLHTRPKAALTRHQIIGERNAALSCPVDCRSYQETQAGLSVRRAESSAGLSAPIDRQERGRSVGGVSAGQL